MIRTSAVVSSECKRNTMMVPSGIGIKGGIKVLVNEPLKCVKPIIVIAIINKKISGPCRINIKDGFELGMDYDGDVLTTFTLFEYLKYILFKKKGDKDDKSTKRR